MRGKKGLEAVWWMIIVFIILAVVAAVIIFGFRGAFGKEKKILEGQIENQCAPSAGICKDDCADDERFVLGIWKDCAQGQVCCAKKSA